MTTDKSTHTALHGTPTSPTSKVVLITGGSRSGKSHYAQRRAEALPGPRTFVATCPVIDGELTERVDRHKRDRAGRGWETIEEQTALVEVMAELRDHPVVLVDCLTLWINNLLYGASTDQLLTEEEITELCGQLLDQLALCRGTVFLVTNEVGWGVVPADALSRRYRDLVGRCNQLIAQRADEVVLMTAGLPLYIKKEHQS